MNYSQLFIPTLREPPRDADAVSSKLMIRSGMIRKLAAGLYDWLPLGLRVLKNVEQIIREEMNAISGQEVWLPHIQPKELWEETGRWGIYGKELLRIKDRKDSEFCFAPTAEEVITDLVRRDVRSYRQLPVMLYQFGTKFRDEIRPRFGIMRSREFYMKDAYSFHADEKDAESYYVQALQAYTRIFQRCGFKFRQVEAETGPIGGSFSHEFMVIADTGEDEIVSCSHCGYAANKIMHAQNIGADPSQTNFAETDCHKCKTQKSMVVTKSIEVGHTFKLGTKYSASMNACYLDQAGKSIPLVMGCYGIGVSRVVAAAIEQRNDQNGIIWTKEMAPFQVIIVPIKHDDSKTMEYAHSIEQELQSAGMTVLMDDRPERAGIKFKDADLIGIPVRLTIGEQGIEKNTVELKPRNHSEAVHVSRPSLLTHLQDTLKNI